MFGIKGANNMQKPSPFYTEDNPSCHFQLSVFIFLFSVQTHCVFAIENVLIGFLVSVWLYDP